MTPNEKPTTEAEFAPAMEEIAWLMAEGSRTHREGEWREHAPQFHIGRAVEHLRLWGEGDQRQDHILHAACRLLMAVTQRSRNADS
jgi:hypothetical protein